VESSLIRPFEVMFRDLKTSEQSLIEANAFLELTTKIVRHDIRHELSVINLSLELYEQSKNDSMLTQAFESIARCTNLIENTQYISSTGAKTDIFPINIRATLLRAIGSSNLRISIDGDGMVMAGAGLLSVFRNIVTNAEMHSNTDRLEITVNRIEDKVLTRISDFGIGVPEGIQEKIFEEGFTAGAAGGSGLGLYIARKLIENYKGTIMVESNQPSGISFIVSLPAYNMS
jgi:signal transduction histidine kinase